MLTNITWYFGEGRDSNEGKGVGEEGSAEQCLIRM